MVLSKCPPSESFPHAFGVEEGWSLPPLPPISMSLPPSASSLVYIPLCRSSTSHRAWRTSFKGCHSLSDNFCNHHVHPATDAAKKKAGEDLTKPRPRIYGPCLTTATQRQNNHCTDKTHTGCSNAYKETEKSLR